VTRVSVLRYSARRVERREAGGGQRSAQGGPHSTASWQRAAGGTTCRVQQAPL
jgi:hypothetical protein